MAGSIDLLSYDDKNVFELVDPLPNGICSACRLHCLILHCLYLDCVHCPLQKVFVVLAVAVVIVMIIVSYSYKTLIGVHEPLFKVHVCI